MAQNTARIYLGDYQLAGSERVFAGRDRGERARWEAWLDQWDRDGWHVVVDIPADTFAVTSSFFLAMFGPSIKLLGGEGFTNKYTFVGWDATDVVRCGVREMLLKGRW